MCELTRASSQYFQRCFPYYQGEIIQIPDLAYTPHPLVERFASARVLVIGGGPSTLRYNWTFSDYNLVCSCNSFFLNEKVAGYVDLAIFMQATMNFDEYVPLLRCVKVFSTSVTYAEPTYKREPQNTILIHPTHWCRLGVATRLVIISAFWGASEVDVVGLDGYPNLANGPVEHAFNGHVQVPKKFTYNSYIEQYKQFWMYMRKMTPNTVFRNLGYKHNYNISTKMLDDKGNWLGPLSR